MTVANFGRYRVVLSNLDKPLFPDEGIRKGDLVDYYRRIAGVMVPYLVDRPLTLHRFPDGIAEAGFYQQSRPDHFPDWLRSRSAPRADDPHTRVEHVLCNNQASLVYLANQGCIALHAWQSRAPRLREPDRLVFDLDPVGDDFATVVRAARQVAGLMRELGMTPFFMTTGSRGLHVLVPLRPAADFERVRELARAMAEALAARHPDALTVEQRRNRRGGRLYLDTLRNAYGQTAIAPYSVRALPGAPVATPLDPDELDDPHLGPRRWRLKNIFRRLGQRPDPWSEMRRHAVSAGRLDSALKALSAG